LTKTEIHDLTKHTYDATRLNAALKTLFESRLARFETVTQPNSKKPLERWYAINFTTPNAELAELNQAAQTTSSANSASSESEETYTASDGNLFNASPKTVADNKDLSELPSYYTYPCFACGATVSNQDSHCPNCDQDLNDLPF